MATIRARKNAKGIVRYTAEVRLRKGKAVVYRETRTFTLRTAAKSWAKCREIALENPDELARAQEDLGHAEAEDYELGKLIRWYIDTFRAISKWGRSKPRGGVGRLPVRLS
jgi:hypothetical protein